MQPPRGGPPVSGGREVVQEAGSASISVGGNDPMAVSAEGRGGGRACAVPQRAAVDAMITACVCHVRRGCRCCTYRLATADGGEMRSSGWGRREHGSCAICGARTRRAFRLRCRGVPEPQRNRTARCFTAHSAEEIGAALSGCCAKLVVCAWQLRIAGCRRAGCGTRGPRRPCKAVLPAYNPAFSGRSSSRAGTVN